MNKEIVKNLLKNRTCKNCIGVCDDIIDKVYHPACFEPESGTCENWQLKRRWHCQYNTNTILLDPNEPHDDGCFCDPVEINDAK